MSEGMNAAADGQTLLQRLRDTLGKTAVVTQPEALAPYLHERRGLFQGRCLAVLRPGDTDGVAEAVRQCADAGVSVVPQGGNTGLCGGAAPDTSGHQVILSLERLDRVRAVDPVGHTITVEAGCTLAEVQRAAVGADRLFPLSYAAEAECRIGGNLSTNAGGMNVLRYGNARDLTLGLEVVLADGRVWNGLHALRKDNSGYDLKDLFIGAEGTLGIITAAVLRLYPRPRHHATALVAVDGPADALALLALLRGETGDALTAFELMAERPVAFALRHGEGCHDPFPARWPWYVLLDVTSSRRRDDLPGLLEAALDGAPHLARDYRIAAEADGRAALWALRNSIPGAQRREGASIKHDVSVPLPAIPAFLERATATVTERLPGIRPCPFGHVGDGNIHFNLSQPTDMDPTAFLARWDEFNRLVHDIVAELDGSFAAEHGVGQLKPGEVERLKPAVERDMMWGIKDALDPGNRLNPGKVVPPRTR
ncbi:putative FAD-linked oxidoreductase [wastewater metagenome]|uniref:Putative FAD-linked oxidoreductase n=4 Tax=root TaxID=1 RepID=A0A5B8RFN1_9ZZZZ|nr:putative FAD-linked oxidoreductase [uncultured organism]